MRQIFQPRPVFDTYDRAAEALTAGLVDVATVRTHRGLVGTWCLAGESVTVAVERKESLRQKREAAIRALRARLAAPHGPERLVRTYEADDDGWIADPLNPGEWLHGCG